MNWTAYTKQWYTSTQGLDHQANKLYRVVPACEMQQSALTVPLNHQLCPLHSAKYILNEFLSKMLLDIGATVKWQSI